MQLQQQLAMVMTLQADSDVLKEKKKYVGSEALPTSNKEKESPRA